MELKAALTRLEELLSLMDESFRASGFDQEKRDRLVMLYGETEDVIHQFEGIQSIKVGSLGGTPEVHKDWISAGFLSAWTTHNWQGRTQLVKVIGKVRLALAEGAGIPETPASVDILLRSLQRFRECCQFIETRPANERQVQDIIWVMLRAQFDRLDREETLPRFGVKAYKPDFGVPDLRTLLEVKFIGPKTELATIQEEVLSDVLPYLKGNQRYSGLVVFVYDGAHKLLDARKFIDDLKAIDGIIEVMVIPGIGGEPPEFVPGEGRVDRIAERKSIRPPRKS